ncbi:hypothetical protein [Methylomicrobium sp. Wu6]|uniref:hypothetical protein n=1 Tax=Methylomicrobium sp. Wu6 TaxID=3107928 RepID=UPI002DD62E15|nr:hypothetical protein [Methylomicrobium sp. Wu6]MEC4748957.1 hypothetical protein [Methylomicrobium sp. Wu6]
MTASVLALELKLPAETSAGAPVGGRLFLTNRGEQPLSLTHPFYNSALNLVVFDRLWNIVTPKAARKAHIAYSTIDLAPAATVVVDLADLCYVSGTASKDYQLDAGRYYILAVFHPGTSRLPAESLYPLVIASNIVQLVVR